MNNMEIQRESTGKDNQQQEKKAKNYILASWLLVRKMLLSFSDFIDETLNAIIK